MKVLDGGKCARRWLSAYDRSHEIFMAATPYAARLPLFLYYLRSRPIRRGHGVSCSLSKVTSGKSPYGKAFGSIVNVRFEKS